MGIMAPSWKYLLPVFAVCSVLLVVVESHIVQPKEDHETEYISREKQNSDLKGQSKALPSLKSRSKQEIEEPEIILFDQQTPKHRVRRTASAVTLAAARRLDEERRRKLGIGSGSKVHYESARRVGTAVRLAAARRGLRVGQRRKTARHWKWDERKKTKEEAEREREEIGTTKSPPTGSAENKLTEEGRRQEELRRQEEERRREEERKKALTRPDENRRNDEEERRKAEEKRQLEERQRQLAEQQEIERQRQIDERRRLLDELRRVGGGDSSREASDEERRRILEELRRLGTWEENDRTPSGGDRGSQEKTTPAPVTARPAHNLRHRCRDCVVGGKSFKGHSRFVYENGCHKFQCICRCDGTHECPDSHKINICDDWGRNPQGKQPETQPEKQTQPQPKNQVGICRTCDAKGQIIEGNNYFDLQEDCTLYRNCRCHCNGTWACAQDKAETICVKKEDGSDSQGPQHHLHVQVGGCNTCHIQGRQYKGNSTFQLRNVCIGTTCKCLCNGTVDCDPDSTVNICLGEEVSTAAPNLEIVISRNQKIYPLKCKQCNVHGNIVEGSSKFNLKWECYLDTCFCDCEGRYSCVRHLGENLCEGKSLEPKGDKVCHGCNTDGRTYPGGSQFQYKQGCDAMDCTCSCEGTLDCDDTTYVNICETTEAPPDPANEVFVPGYGHGSNPSACSNCLFNGSTIHGNSYFERKQGCYVEQCHCQCDGRLNCRRIPGQPDGLCEESTGGTKPDQVLCRRCSFLGSDYPGNSTFPYNNGCSLTLCKCNCNGTTICDYSTTVNICEDDKTTPEPDAKTTARPENCKACEVEGKEFAGGAEFELKRGCKSYPCQCHCNGRWGCEINEAKDVCGKDPVSGPSVDSTGCRKCELDGFYYAGESRFQFTNSCVTINCKCECSGSVQCDYTSTVNNCVTRITTEASVEPEEPTSAPPVDDGCKRCTADGKTYKGNSNFELKRGCMVYPCECNCNGQWGCQTHKAKDVCSKDSALSAGSCQRCSVEGKEYDGNMTFYHTHDCVRRTCFCACTGTVQCDEDSAENVCEPPNGGNGNNAETFVNLVECHNCQFHGKNYEGNSSIIHNEGCKVKSCRCTCSGAVECDDSTEVDICATTHSPVRRSHKRRKDEKCKQCGVAGSQYDGGSTFKLKRGCLVYACNCACSGRWFCNTNEPSNVCKETGNDKTSCFPCDVKGRRFAGGSEFKLREGCISHKCTCSCDGTWECPPEKSANHCPGSTLPPEFVTENDLVN